MTTAREHDASSIDVAVTDESICVRLGDQLATELICAAGFGLSEAEPFGAHDGGFVDDGGNVFTMAEAIKLALPMLRDNLL